MSFTELDHTADILIRVHAPTLESCFAECGLALMTVMYRDIGSTPPVIQRTVTVWADDSAGLLHDFLSDLLCLSESENLVFSGITVRLSGENRLDADLSGDVFDPGMHGGGAEVKGISFSGLDIFKDEQGYDIDILFDV